MTDFMIEIRLPDDFFVLSVTACLTPGLASTTACSTEPLDKKILIQYFTTSEIDAGDTIEFTVDSIQNPGVYESPGDVIVSVLSSAGGSIDSGTYTIEDDTFTHNNITDFYVEVSDPTAGEVNVLYTFTIIPASRVAQYSFLAIYLPDDVTISSEDDMQGNCPGYDVYGFSDDYIRCQYDSDMGAILIENGFESSTSQGDPPTLIFYIPNLSNPRS
jgi:hypothetical protein